VIFFSSGESNPVQNNLGVWIWLSETAYALPDYPILDSMPISSASASYQIDGRGLSFHNALRTTYNWLYLSNHLQMHGWDGHRNPWGGFAYDNQLAIEAIDAHTLLVGLRTQNKIQTIRWVDRSLNEAGKRVAEDFCTLPADRYAASIEIVGNLMLVLFVNAFTEISDTAYIRSYANELGIYLISRGVAYHEDTIDLSPFLVAGTDPTGFGSMCTDGCSLYLFQNKCLRDTTHSYCQIEKLKMNYGGTA